MPDIRTKLMEDAKNKKTTAFVGFQLDQDYFDAVIAIAKEADVKPAVAWRAIIMENPEVQKKAAELKEARAQEANA